MKYFTANEIRDRYREELVKFKIEIDSHAYLNDAAALTFSSANVSNSPESKIRVITDLSTNKVTVFYGEQEVPEDVALRLLDALIINRELLEESVSGVEPPVNIEGGIPIEGSESNVNALLREETPAESLNRAIASESAASENVSVSSNRLVSSKSNDPEKFADAVKFLCGQIAAELESDLEQVEVAEEVPDEQQQSDAGAAASRAASQAAASAKKEQLIGLTINVEQTSKLLDRNLLGNNPPAQIRKMASGEPTFGVTGDNASISVYGSIQVIKRVILDPENLEAQLHEPVTVAEVLEGLPDGKYETILFEDPDLGITSILRGAPREGFVFKVRNPRQAAPEEEIKEQPSDEEIMEAKADARIQELIKENAAAEEEAAIADEKAQDEADARAAQRAREAAARAAEEERARDARRLENYWRRIRRLINRHPEGRNAARKLLRDTEEVYAKGRVKIEQLEKDVRRMMERIERDHRAAQARRRRQAEENRRQREAEENRRQREREQQQQQAEKADPPPRPPNPDPGGGGGWPGPGDIGGF